MVKALCSLVCFHTSVAVRQCVRARLLTLTAWLASLLLAIAASTYAFWGHVERRAALGAQVSELEANCTTGGKYGGGVVRVESWTDRMYVPDVPN